MKRLAAEHGVSIADVPEMISSGRISRTRAMMLTAKDVANLRRQAMAEATGGLHDLASTKRILSDWQQDDPGNYFFLQVCGLGALSSSNLSENF